MDRRRRRPELDRHYRRGKGRRTEWSGLTFLQISDSHVGFDKPANPNALGTLEEAVNKIKALPVKPSFVIHTGDITHLSKPSEFDDADRIISQARLDVHYVPGEHDVLDEDVKLYRDRYGRGTKGAGWYSFDANGVHFIGLVNVVDLKAGGLGNLGNEQLEWLEDDLKAARPQPRSSSSPTFRCGRSIRPGDRIGDGAQRSHPPNHAESRRQRHLSHRYVDRLPAARAGRGTFAGTDESRRRQAALGSRDH
jgi:3',5'-cyclic AMP phosphodiesterase CpdA